MTDTRLFGLHPYIPAAILAIVVLIPIALTPEPYRNDLLAYQLLIIAGVYIGFAVNDGRPVVMAIEVAHLAGFIALTLLGLWISPWFLVVGYFSHGAWDLLHRPSLIQTELARWYPPLCLVYDWIFGAVLIFWLVV
ncbi:MAG: DUF6010 family protein [Chloroflexota bacterium]